MADLYQERSHNVFKTYMLMAVFLIIVIAIGWAVSWYYNSPAILYGAVIFSVLMNVGSYWFSDKIALSMNGARPATREEYFDLYTVTENLSITAGMEMPKLYVIEDPAPNAFATGRDEKHAVVAATTGLLSLLTRAELEGVIAHELSHIRNKDMLVMTVAVVLAGFIAIIADLFLRMSLFGGGDRGDNKSGALFLVLALVAAILAPLAAQLIQMAISRRREFLADSSGALLTRYPEGLASALQKISGYAQPMRRANHATAHLFIGNPFGNQAGKFMNRIFSTHPPVEDRVEALLGKGA
ncbi:M48 family metallopeptidase [Patescibacteria group bacterium]|nr:M48 family metallopeptidase [Patescibacteria group bacterium]MBU1500750.1 M48 family metallopeptidase [Patescibacteria group bacterium]MBU2080805.1 M48 family metallopeptidase [Patescibacteria group bacterium]MBU2123910.1 M48 family metallopeptidase [Patescibacteria group bacterium]MBU2194799.1 M48 family metallopeptidase [Patescibacteria group bacterium]